MFAISVESSNSMAQQGTSSHTRTRFHPGTLPVHTIVNANAADDSCPLPQRHVHSVPCTAPVPSGGYEEAGDNGRFEVDAGNIVFHDQFEAHLNRFSKQRTIVLNFGYLNAAAAAVLSKPSAFAKAQLKNPVRVELMGRIEIGHCTQLVRVPGVNNSAHAARLKPRSASERVTFAPDIAAAPIGNRPVQ
jgi:hypothetical protein